MEVTHPSESVMDNMEVPVKTSGDTRRHKLKKLTPTEKRVRLRTRPLVSRTAESLTKSLMKPHIDIEVEDFKEKLEAGGDPNGDPNIWGDWRPIFWAATSGNVQILSALLSDERIIVDVTDNKGYSALHHAVISACRKGDRDEKFYYCIDILMRNEKMKLNLLDKKGYTAIARAVEYPHLRCVERMLKHPCAHRLNLDHNPGDRESTVRDIIFKTFPQFQSLLPLPLREDINSEDKRTKVLAALQEGNYKIFRECIDTDNINPWYDESYHSSLLELACQMRNREEYVTLLLHNGADPNIPHRITGMPLLHMTARCGNLDTLEVLLKHDGIDANLKDIEDRTILHWLCRISGEQPGDRLRLETCFELLLDTVRGSRKVDINCKDSSETTALQIAVEREYQERVILLLRYGADVTVTKHGSPVLSSISTSTLENILDECVETNDEPVTSRDFRLTFRYEFLANILHHMTDSPHLRSLLRHPVISSFLSLKWKQIRVFFYLDLAFYVFFVLFLTIYILFSDFDNARDIENISPNKTANYVFEKIGENRESNHTKIIDYSIGDQVPQYFWVPLMMLLCLLALRETFQLFIYGTTYILSPENWLECLLIISTTVSCSGLVQNNEVKLHFSAIAILLGWLELVLLSGRLPLLSVQLEMLKTVSLTFLRFMAGYVLLLVAFALSFYILFKGSLENDGEDMFVTPYMSMLKTIVMFTGELEASNLKYDNLPYTSHAIFLLFVFLVAIVLLNLLNGLAVNDTEVIRKDAEVLSLVARVKLITKIETVMKAFPRCILFSEKLTDKIFVLYPNRPNSIEPIAIRSSLRLVHKKKAPNKKRKLHDIQGKWSELSEMLAEMQKRQNEIEKNFEAKFEETQKLLMRVMTHLQDGERKVSSIEV
ncbi:transient receptor potential cation channel protein painless-like isoform X1 [Periplaneta americana]|uniref:transient receptor potential cation channel protein painless-like isoform X1 n=1 Tax=Periplaneta americana TaxID=6978 RepID=UPI0037E750ED